MGKKIVLFLAALVLAAALAGCGPAYVSGAVEVRGCWIDGIWYVDCPPVTIRPGIRYYYPPPYPPGYRHPRHPPHYRPPAYRPPPPPHRAPPPRRHAPPPRPHSHLPQHHGSGHEMPFHAHSR